MKLYKTGVAVSISDLERFDTSDRLKSIPTMIFLIGIIYIGTGLPFYWFLAHTL